MMFDNFDYDYKSILVSGNSYEVIKGSSKKSGLPKLIKIIQCDKLGGANKAKNSIKQELDIHKTLESSECILKLEHVFEHNLKIYMIFEGAVPMSLYELTQNKKKEKTDILLVNVLIALSEINSLGLSMSYLSV